MTAELTPPPLPPRPAVAGAGAVPASKPRPRFGLPGWLIALIAGCLLLILLFAGGVAWFIGTGWHLFAGQAQTALQAQPAVQQHIGTIREMSVDLIATGEAPGGEEFVFRLEGDRGSGRVQATFVSLGAEQEIITEGELTLADGQRYELEDQSASDEDAGDEYEEDSEQADPIDDASQVHA